MDRRSRAEDRETCVCSPSALVPASVSLLHRAVPAGRRRRRSRSTQSRPPAYTDSTRTASTPAHAFRFSHQSGVRPSADRLAYQRQAYSGPCRPRRHAEHLARAHAMQQPSSAGLRPQERLPSPCSCCQRAASRLILTLDAPSGDKAAWCVPTATAVPRSPRIVKPVFQSPEQAPALSTDSASSFRTGPLPSRSLLQGLELSPRRAQSRIHGRPHTIAFSNGAAKTSARGRASSSQAPPSSRDDVLALRAEDNVHGA